MQVQFKIKSLVVICVLSMISTAATAAESTQKSREEIRQIMDSCSQSAGLTKLAPGERPTAPTSEQVASIDACLKQNNVQPLTRMQGRRGPVQQKSNSLLVQ